MPSHHSEAMSSSAVAMASCVRQKLWTIKVEVEDVEGDPPVAVIKGQDVDENDTAPNLINLQYFRHSLRQHHVSQKRRFQKPNGFAHFSLR